jgi:hypothetical protein
MEGLSLWRKNLHRSEPGCKIDFGLAGFVWRHAALNPDYQKHNFPGVPLEDELRDFFLA